MSGKKLARCGMNTKEEGTEQLIKTTKIYQKVLSLKLKVSTL